MLKTGTPTTFKSEFEVQSGDGPFLFVGDSERVAIQKAIGHAHSTRNDRIKIFHTHPSPGPVRSYVGWVGRDGVLHRTR